MAKLSPQSKWARRQKNKGRCTRCGAPRKRHSQLCDKHQKAANAYMRAWRSAKKATGPCLT